MSTVARRGRLGLSLVLLVFSIVTTAVIPHPDTGRLIFADAFFASFAALQWYEATRRVTLTDDGIEVADWFSVRTLRWDEIQARRIQLGNRGGWRHVLIPADPGQRPLKFPWDIDTDAALNEWLRPIRRLGQKRRRFW